MPGGSGLSPFVLFPIGLILIIVSSDITSETDATRRDWIAEYGPAYAPWSGISTCPNSAVSI
jgi:hypothetical protein